MTCKNCKASIPDDAVFCPFCGQRVVGETLTEPTYNSGFQQEGAFVSGSSKVREPDVERESGLRFSSNFKRVETVAMSIEESAHVDSIEKLAECAPESSMNEPQKVLESSEYCSNEEDRKITVPKQRLKIIISLGVLVIGIILVCILLVPKLGINPFKTSVKEQSYDRAFSLYVDMTSEDQQKANSWLAEYIETVEQQYYENKTDYVSVSTIITELERFDAIQDTCTKLSHDIFLDNQSSQFYDQAKHYADEGKWMEAYQALDSVHNEYRFFEDVTALKEGYAVNCRSEVIGQMSACAAAEEFSKLQSIKDTALSILPNDTAIIQAYDQHCSQYIQTVLERANSFGAEQNYVDAIRVLEYALTLLDSDELVEAVSQYTTTYANDIIADIPSSLVAFTVDGVSVDLSIDSLEIIKRQTNEKDDHVYCTLTMSNADYQLSLDCYFLYNYYDIGGWILDYYEIQNQPILTPLTGVPTETAHSFLSQYYEVVGTNSATFSADTGISCFDFSIQENHSYCSFYGNIDVYYSFSYQVDFEENVCNISSRWSPEVGSLGNITYDWNIEGSWYAAIYRTSGHGVGEFTGYELYLDVTQLNGNSIAIEAVSPYDGSEYNHSNNRMEYIGNTEVTYDYSTHGDPTLTFNFTIRKDGSAYYTIIISKDRAIVHKDGIKNNDIVKL